VPNRAATGRAWLSWLGLAIVVVVLDQASKIVVEHALAYGERVRVLPVFDLTLVYNLGAAFNFLAAEPGWQRWMFTLLGIVASVVILWLLRRPVGRPAFKTALALILGGALGNVIDRIAYGHVIDFLLFYWRGWYYPAFNLADAAITCGAVLLVADELLRGRAKQ
jgi:signal peptidase II